MHAGCLNHKAHKKSTLLICLLLLACSPNKRQLRKFLYDKKKTNDVLDMMTL